MHPSEMLTIIIKITVGLIISVVILKLKRFSLSDNLMYIIPSVLIFAFIAPVAYFAGVALSQSIEVVWLVLICAVISLVFGIVNRSQISIPFVIGGAIFISLHFPSISFKN